MPPKSAKSTTPKTDAKPKSASKPKTPKSASKPKATKTKISELVTKSTDNQEDQKDQEDSDQDNQEQDNTIVKKTKAKTTTTAKEDTEPEILPGKLTLNPSGKVLVIVESPGKIKKIQSILGDNYIVTASVGHIIDLGSKLMSIDIQNNFKPKYVSLQGKGAVIRDLKKLAKNSSDILLATDEDREGEMIAWSLAYVLGIEKPKRITFNSITEQEIIKAIKSPKDIDSNMVDAQKSRRMLDRIVGYEISPLLWKSIGQSLSAGRVQSVVVRIILDREKEIQDFLKDNIKSDFKFKANFFKDIIATLYQTKKPTKTQEIVELDDNLEQDQEQEDKIQDDNVSGTLIKGYKTTITTQESAKDLMQKIIDSEFKIVGKGERTQMRTPAPPFTTSTLQQEAARKLGFTIKRTMTAAQHLYEAGHITYMRTDSTNLSAEALKSIGKYIKDTYGNNYHTQRHYAAKTNNTQEAHESVRPTHIEVTGLNESGKISSDEMRLYLLIWKRAIASQMSPAKLSVATTHISISKTKDYYFQTEISTILFEGFLKVYNIQNIEINDDNNNDNNISTKIPELGEKLKLITLEANQDYQKPPPRYNEASLVNKLDPKNLNIGRPSTYAAIITKIQERGYVEKRDNDGIKKSSIELKWTSTSKNINETTKDIYIAKDANKLTPTAIGKVVTEFLVTYFPDLMDYKFTSTMETKLDLVANGDLKLLKLLSDFYHTDFHPIIDKLLKEKIKYVDKDQKEIGKDEFGNSVIVTIKRYGPVVMIEQNKDGKIKTLNIAPLKAPLTADNITLDEALKILSYPKSLGKYENKEVKLFKGKFGLYAKYGDTSINLSNVENEEDITLELVTERITQKKSKNLWEGKEGKTNYVVLEGPYGKYISIKDGAKKLAKPMNVKLPEDTDIKDLTLDKVKEIVEKGKVNKFKSKRFFKK